MTALAAVIVGLAVGVAAATFAARTALRAQAAEINRLRTNLDVRAAVCPDTVEEMPW